MRQPRNIADRSRDLHDLSKRKDDTLQNETFRLPLHSTRLKACHLLDEYQAGGYTAVVENWRQLPDGQIEFTTRRLPTAD